MGLVPWAAVYVGLPYEPNGRTRAGVDCYGLVTLVLEEVFNIRLPSYAHCYESPREWPAIRTAVVEGLRDWVPVPIQEARVGDGVVLRLQGQPMHVGVIVDTAPLTMLHVLADINVCCQRLDTPTWAPRLVGCYRWQRRR
jgi:cell wall-associated NlpC family hydrolase